MSVKAALKALRVFSGTFSAIRAVKTSEGSVTEQKLQWAKEMLSTVCLKVTVMGASPTLDRPSVFVGNHLSYLDIPLLLTIVPDLNFVAKKELGSWPIFGPGVEKTKTILVDRDSKESRNSAKETLRHSIEKERKAVIVFPSGTTCLDEQKPWKPGAFRLAQETGVLLQPFRIRYDPLRTAAFIDDDGFVAHLYKLGCLDSVNATLEFAPAEMVTDPEASRLKWQAWSAEGLRSSTSPLASG